MDAPTELIELANRYALELGSPPNLWDCSRRMPLQVMRRWAVLHRIRAYEWTRGEPYSYPQIAAATTGRTHSSIIGAVRRFAVLLEYASRDTGLACGRDGKSCGYGGDWPVCDRHRHVFNPYADELEAKYVTLWPEAVRSPHVLFESLIENYRMAQRYDR